MSKPEGKFQKKFCDWLTEQGFKWIRVKANGNSNKGKPDVAVFYGNFWGWLEFKKSKEAEKQPGQQENVDWAQENSFGIFVYPENAEEIKNLLLICKQEASKGLPWITKA